jgi:hypothetical protein
MAAHKLSVYAVICRLKINKEVMCMLSVFITFYKYLTYSEDLVYCRPFHTITTLIVYIGHNPIKHNVGEDTYQ